MTEIESTPLPLHKDSEKGAKKHWGTLKLALDTTVAFLHPTTASVGENIAFGSKRQSLLTRPTSQPPPPLLLSKFLLYSHLAFFGIVGCFIRILIEENTKLFGTSGTSSYFISIPANMLGSFVLGMLSPEPGYPTGVGVFPVKWHWIQDNSFLQRGLRTGLCGSLTTFSGWNHQMVAMSLSGVVKYIVQSFFGYLIGFIVCIGCVDMGLHFRLLVVDYRHVKEWRQHHLKEYRTENDTENEDKKQQRKGFNFAWCYGNRLEQVAPSISSDSPSSQKESAGNKDKNSDKVKNDPFPAKLQIKFAQFIVCLLLVLSLVLSLYTLVSEVEHISNKSKQTSVRTAFIACSLLLAPFGVFIRNYLGVKLNPLGKKKKQDNRSEKKDIEAIGNKKTMLDSVCICFRKNCFLLSDDNTINNVERAPFFYGTFAANVSGAFIVAIVKAILNANSETIDSRQHHVIQYVVLSALSTGFAGCLSTASTFAGEIRTLMSHPDTIHREHQLKLLQLDWEEKHLGSKDSKQFGNTAATMNIMDPLCPVGAYQYALSTVFFSTSITLVFYGLMRHVI